MSTIAVNGSNSSRPIKENFTIKKRGNIEVKGKGKMFVYFLLGIK